MVDSGFTVCEFQSMSRALKSPPRISDAVIVSAESLNVSQVLL